MKLSPTYNLLVCFPEIAAQWDYEANFPLRPEDVAPSSDKKPGWKCAKDLTHKWMARVCNRTGKNKRGCPVCAGKLPSPTHNLLICFPEVAAQWDYEANFPLLPEKLTPASHQKPGWVCAKDPTHRWVAKVCDRTGGGDGCPFCSGRFAAPTHNLAHCFPEIAAEWDYEANKGLRPEDVPPASNQKAGWVCAKDPTHKWVTTSRNRTGKNKTGCPCCSGRVSTPTNNLLICFPEIAAGWDYEANYPLRPEDVTPFSHQKPGWFCTKDPTHKWTADISSRTCKNKNGCPHCARAQGRSKAEIEIYEHVRRIYPDAISSDREELKRYELDVYIPSLKKAIEYDGTYWHSIPRAIVARTLGVSRKVSSSCGSPSLNTQPTRPPPFSRSKNS